MSCHVMHKRPGAHWVHPLGNITLLLNIIFRPLRPCPHYTVFKQKRYCFVPDTATVHTTTLKTITENGSFRKRSPEGATWKRYCLKTLFSWFGRRRCYLKTMTSPQQHYLVADHSTVSISKIVDRRFLAAWIPCWSLWFLVFWRSWKRI